MDEGNRASREEFQILWRTVAEDSTLFDFFLHEWDHVKPNTKWESLIHFQLWHCSYSISSWSANYSIRGLTIKDGEAHDLEDFSFHSLSVFIVWSGSQADNFVLLDLGQEPSRAREDEFICFINQDDFAWLALKVHAHMVVKSRL